MKRPWLALTSICAAATSTQVAIAQNRTSVAYLHPVGFSPAPLGPYAIGPRAIGVIANPLSEARHGVIGAVSGAIVGGGLGFLYMVSHCDNGVCGFPGRAVLTGAAAGAVVGVIVEYGIRSWPEQKARLAAEARAAQGYSCHESDFFSAMLISQITESAGDSATRRVLGLPYVPPSQIVLATDPAFCNRAGLAIDSIAHAQHPDQPKPPQGTGSYYVIKIGAYTGVASFDRGSSKNRTGYLPLFIFSPLWELKSVAGM